jgi:gas vesicle protein
MGMMKLGAMGALAGLVLVPVISSKTRKRISRSSRNAYFRMTDFVNDLRDMTSR